MARRMGFLVSLVALLLFGAGITFAQDVVVGEGKAIIRDNNTRSDSVHVSMSGVTLPPAGYAYEGWLVSGDRTTWVSIGILPVDQDGNIEYGWTEPAGDNLVDLYQEFVITQEPESDPDPANPSGDEVFGHRLPDGSVVHLRHLLVDAQPFGTPAGVGFATGLLNQIAAADQHAALAATAADTGNFTETRMHAEHLVNILEGIDGDHYGDLDGNGQAENSTGDDFGVLPTESDLEHGYGPQTAIHANAAAATPDATGHIWDHNFWVQGAVQHALFGAEVARDLALGLLGGTVGSVVPTDLNGDSDAMAVELDHIPPPGSHYEAWLMDSGSVNPPLRLDTLQPDFEGHVSYFWSSDPSNPVNLVGAYDQFVISIEPDPDTDPDNPSGVVAFSDQIPAGALGPIRELLVTTDGTPDSTAFAVGLRDEAGKALDHAQNVVNTIYAFSGSDSTDLAEARGHAEHVVNIILGGNPRELDGNTTPENPGDGWGIWDPDSLTGYAQDVWDQADSAASVVDTASFIWERATKIQMAVSNVKDWAGAALYWADSVLAVTDPTNLTQAQDAADSLAYYADLLFNGWDADTDGHISADEGGAWKAYRQAQKMAAYHPTVDDESFFPLLTGFLVQVTDIALNGGVLDLSGGMASTKVVAAGENGGALQAYDETQNMASYPLGRGIPPAPGTAFTRAGQPFSIPVVIPDVSDLGFISAELDVSFDHNYITATGARLGEAADGASMAFNPNAGPGLMEVSLANPMDLPGNGVLVWLDFMANQGVPSGTGTTVRVEGFFNEEEVGLGPIEVQVVFGMLGDVSDNGQVGAFDAALILQHVVEIIHLPAPEYPAFVPAIADVSGDGTASAYDASLVLQHSVNLIDHFPVEGGFFNGGGTNKVALQKARVLTWEARHSDGNLSLALTADDRAGILAGEFALSFDPAQIRVAGVTPVGLTATEAAQLVHRSEEGKVEVAFATIEALSGKGQLLQIDFELVNGSIEDLSHLVATTGIRINEGRIPVTVVPTVQKAIPAEFSLAQNHPNPFNPATTIAFGLPKASFVRLAIYNLLGQEIRVLVDSQLAAGFHSVVWDGRDNQGRNVASGVYFYRLSSAGFSQSRKLMLLK